MKIYLIKHDGVMNMRSSPESIGVAVTSLSEYNKFKETDYFKNKGYKIKGQYDYEIIEVLDSSKQIVDFLNNVT